MCQMSDKKEKCEQEKRRYQRICADHPTYRVWRGIMHRSGTWKNSNPKDVGLYDSVRTPLYAPWKNFSIFEAWATANGWAPGLQIDRIDGSKGYSPDNCRFVTTVQNRRNRLDNLRILFRGRKMLFAEAFDMVKPSLNYYTVRDRISKLGWDAEKAFSTPAGRQGMRYAH